MKITNGTLRQIAAALISVYGVLSLKDVAPHLPTWLASVMVLVAPAAQALQHYLDHPSTGTTTELSTAQTDHLNALTGQLHQETRPVLSPSGWTITTPAVEVASIDPLTGQARVANPAPPAPNQ